MSNYCECHLRVNVDDFDNLQVLEEFVEKAKGENGAIDFNKFIQYPQEWVDQDKEQEAFQQMTGKEKDEYLKTHKKPIHAYSDHGYHWCIKNWGTKWNADEIIIERESNHYISYVFDTAWTLPLPIILEMSKQFPTLRFELQYYEMGLAFQGEYYYFNGEVIFENSRDYYGTRGG